MATWIMEVTLSDDEGVILEGCNCKYFKMGQEVIECEIKDLPPDVLKTLLERNLI